MEYVHEMPLYVHVVGVSSVSGGNSCLAEGFLRSLGNGIQLEEWIPGPYCGRLYLVHRPLLFPSGCHDVYSSIPPQSHMAKTVNRMNNSSL